MQHLGRIPPQAVELEDAILGAILNEGQGRYDMVFDILQDQDCFYSPKNAELWALMHKMILRGAPVDLLSVTSECKGSRDMGKIWTPYSLTQLSNSITTTANVESYCYKVLEKFKARQVIEICGNASKSAYEDDIFEVLQYAEDSIFELSMGGAMNEYRSASAIANETINALIKQINNPKDLTGVPAGIKSLDVITGGWQNSDLIIIGAQSGVGKTAFALNLTIEALRSGVGVGFFTMEMKDTQLISRLYSIDSRVPLDFIKKANLSNEQLERVAASSNFISTLPLYIDQTPNSSVYEVRAKARKMKTKHGIGLIVVDYLQLMKGDGNSRELEVASISRGLKGLAKSLDVPIIALSQLNKDGDVRESKAIEHDANILMVIERADYKKSKDEVDPTQANTAELKIVKNRDGVSGVSIMLDTELSTQRFFEPSIEFIAHVDNPMAGFKNLQYFDTDERTAYDQPF